MKTVLVRHALVYPNEGLVIARHNEICDNIIHLAKQALFRHFVRSKPQIHLVISRSEEEVRQEWSVLETRGGVSIWVI